MNIVNPDNVVKPASSYAQGVIHSAAAERIVISGSDPLNLVGILTPGRRVPSVQTRRIAFVDGLPEAPQDAGRISEPVTTPRIPRIPPMSAGS